MAHESLKLRIENMEALTTSSALIGGFAVSVLLSTETNPASYPYESMAWCYTVLMLGVCVATFSCQLVNSVCSYLATRFFAYERTKEKRKCEMFLERTADLRFYTTIVPQLAIPALLTALALRMFETSNVYIATFALIVLIPTSFLLVRTYISLRRIFIEVDFAGKTNIALLASVNDEMENYRNKVDDDGEQKASPIGLYGAVTGRSRPRGPS